MQEDLTQNLNTSSFNEDQRETIKDNFPSKYTFCNRYKLSKYV